MSDPTRDVFDDRERASSFGADARAYDATRPSYPAALVAWLTADGAGDAVDVGCGTGQVARLLQAAGWRVVGVEPDDRMAEVARGHGVTVEVSTFERWRPGRRVDLITSGQAWHWIDPAVGYDHAAHLLRPEGRLALFWTTYHYDERTRTVFDEIVGTVAPDLLEDSVPFGTSSPEHAALDAEAIVRTGAFEDPMQQVFEHGRRLSVAQWLAEARTHSGIAGLPPNDREGLLMALERGLTRTGSGAVDVGHLTRVTSARRR